MADRNPTVVITADETLPEVIDRVRGAASGGRTVDLVAPIDSPLLLTASEFRALKDAIDEQRLSVVLRTADPLRLRLGDRLGIRVQALARPVPAARVPESVRAASPLSADPIAEEVPTNGASQLELPRPDPESSWPYLDSASEAVADSDGAHGGEEETPIPAEPSNPPRRWLPAVVLLVLIVAGAFFAIRFVVPRAVILVTPKSAPVAATLYFDVTADGQPIDSEAAFALEQDEREIEVVWEGSAPASGVRVEPDGTASGPIELRNASAEPVQVDAGTVVTTETGVEFSFVEAVEVPAADAATGEPGAATGRVSAVAAGTGGNVGTGEIGGRLPNGIYYSNRMEPTSGGTDKEFAVIAQEDLDLLSAQAQEAAAALAQDALSGEEGEGAPRVTSVSIVRQQDVFDHQAGDDAESVALRATMTVEAATFDEVEAASAYQAALTERLQEEAPEGYAVAQGDVAFDPPIEEFADERGIRLAVEASADARAELDDAERAALADALAGRSAEEAEDTLGRTPDIADYTVTYTPMWLPKQMPNSAGRIEIEVAP